jgi:hypothetical protein
MKNKFKLAGFTLLLIAFLQIINGCRKNDNDINTTPTEQTIQTTIAGTAIKEDKTPIAGVLVTINGQTAVTDFTGSFILKNINVSATRCIIKYSYSGYYDAVVSIIPQKQTINYARAILIKKDAPTSFNASTGITITLPDGTIIILPANGYVTSSGNAYNGVVGATVHHLSPDEPDFGLKIPGSDLLGIDVGGNEKVLVSYGMINVELTDNAGNKLQLASGKPATLMYPVAASQTAAAPSTMPHWYFYEKINKWKEDGTATRNGNYFIATASHFTWWNCDYPYDRATIQGKVVYCNGTPGAFLVVTVNGGNSTLTTDANGFFTNWIPAGQSFTFQVLASNNNGLTIGSQIETTPILTLNQVFTVSDLILACPTFLRGMAVDCNNNLSDNARVYANWNGGSSFAVSTNGKFQLPVPTSIFVSLFVINSSGFYIDGFITPNTSGANQNIGQIQLCNSLGLDDNLLTLAGNGLDGSYQLDTANAFGYVSGSNERINVQGTIAGFNQPFSFKFFNPLPLQEGTYNLAAFDTVRSAILNFGNHSIISWGTGSASLLKINFIEPIGGYIYFEVLGRYTEYDAQTIPHTIEVSNLRMKVKRLQ